MQFKNKNCGLIRPSTQLPQWIAVYCIYQNNYIAPSENHNNAGSPTTNWLPNNLQHELLRLSLLLSGNA